MSNTEYIVAGVLIVFLGAVSVAIFTRWWNEYQRLKALDHATAIEKADADRAAADRRADRDRALIEKLVRRFDASHQALITILNGQGKEYVRCYEENYTRLCREHMLEAGGREE